jgi:hypothetical protein
MELLIAGLSITAVAITTALLLLAAFRTGTRQEHAGSLCVAAPGRAARLTRRITGLYAEPPPPAQHPYALSRAPRAIPAEKGARTPWQ